MNLFAVFFVIGATLVLQGAELPSLTTLGGSLIGFLCLLAAMAAPSHCIFAHAWSRAARG